MLYSEKLESKESQLNRGVRCPFSFLKDEPAPNTCVYTEEHGKHYFLSLDDLYNLVRYGELLQVSDFCVRCEDTGLPGLYDFLQSIGINTEADLIASLPGISEILEGKYPTIQSTNSVQNFIAIFEPKPLSRARSVSDPDGEDLIVLTREQVTFLTSRLQNLFECNIRLLNRI